MRSHRSKLHVPFHIQDTDNFLLLSQTHFAIWRFQQLRITNAGEVASGSYKCKRIFEAPFLRPLEGWWGFSLCLDAFEIVSAELFETINTTHKTICNEQQVLATVSEILRLE